MLLGTDKRDLAAVDHAGFSFLPWPVAMETAWFVSLGRKVGMQSSPGNETQAQTLA